MNERLQELCDRADIFACMQRYRRGMDRRDRELVRSAYHDDAVDEHIGFVGHVDKFIDWAFAYHQTQTRYQHYLLNHTADIAGDQAHAEPAICSSGRTASHLTINGGRYADRLQRCNDRTDTSYDRPLNVARACRLIAQQAADRRIRGCATTQGRPVLVTLTKLWVGPTKPVGGS